MPPRVSEQEFKNWWLDPVGIEVRNMLFERMNTIAHALAKGSCMGNIGASPVHYGESVGRYEEIQDLLNMTYKELMGEE